MEMDKMDAILLGQVILIVLFVILIYYSSQTLNWVRFV